MCAGKHMAQKQDGTFKMEETLIQMLFTNREVSLKQPREGSSPECGEDYEERQLRGAVLFLRGDLQGWELEKSVSWPHAPLTLRSSAGAHIGWAESIGWGSPLMESILVRLPGTEQGRKGGKEALRRITVYINLCNSHKGCGLLSSNFTWGTWSLERLATGMWWRWGFGSRLFQSWAM